MEGQTGLCSRYEGYLQCSTKEMAAAELDHFEELWGSKYPYDIKSWRNNWEELTAYFDFPLEIRKIIYTTNLIENLNGKSGSTRKAKDLFLRIIP